MVLVDVIRQITKRDNSRVTAVKAVTASPAAMAVKPEATPTPTYNLPFHMIVKAIYAFARRRTRDIWADAHTMISENNIKPVIQGLENVPEKGAFVLIPNHYERKDAVWVGWGAIAMLNTIGHTRSRAGVPMLHWVMTDTWADCYIGPFLVPPKYLGWVLKGFGDIYGIIRMPAHDLPNHDLQRPRSATALHEMFDCLSRGESVAVHPEAGGFETLVQPPRGAGRVLACLERRKVPVIPVGVYEEDGHLRINFGKPMAPNSFQRLGDREAADVAMLAICKLIPEQNRGVYAERFAELERDALAANVG